MKRYKILFLSSEISSFTKESTLADFSYQLPLVLKELGHEVRVMMPKYKIINERKYVLREVIRLKDIGIPVGDEVKTINVKSAFIPNSKVQIYFIDYKPYFNRDGLYFDERRKKEYTDNDSRFILFSRGVLETLKLLFWQPDIIHCNDWQTGLIPLYIKTIYKEDKFFKKTSTVFTIHNINEAGCFEKDTEKKTGLADNKNYNEKYTEFNRKFSFLKAGITSSDYLSISSENYIKRLQNISELPVGLSEVVKKRKGRLFGILSGVDYLVWNPEIDKAINTKYNFKTISNKNENKKFLLRKVKLPFKSDIPLIGWVYRKTDSEIFKVLENIAKELSALKLQIVIVGKIEKKLLSKLTKYKNLYPENFSFYSSDNEKLMHIIIGGCDVILLPFLYYPNEINPLNCLKYGTIPIVRNIGEFSDIMVEFNSQNNSGNGLLIKEYSSTEILRQFKNVIKLFNGEKTWRIIQKNGMKEEILWKNTAKKFLKIYSSALRNQK